MISAECSCGWFDSEGCHVLSRHYWKKCLLRGAEMAQ